MPAEFISGRELAKRLGITEGAVRKAAKSKRIKRGPGGKYNAELAAKQWEANTTPSISRPAPSVDLDEVTSSLYHRERALRERAARRLLEQELSEQSGELVKASEVQERWEAILMLVKDALASFPDKLTPELAGLQEEHQVRDVLKREVEAILYNLHAVVKNAN